MNRRRFLKGLGVCIALPALESLLPRPLVSAASGATSEAAAGAAASGAAGAAVTATGAPLRTAVIYFPNGAIPANWWPTGAGETFALNKTMEPLESLKYKMQILGGLDDVSANPGPDGGGDHARANSTFLSGVRIKKTAGRDYYSGISFDQVIAKNVGHVTPYSSLEISCDTVRNAGACDTGYSCIYEHNLAWSSPTTPMTPEVNPRLLFERLFGAGSPKDRTQNLIMRQRQQQSILDFVAEDTQSLQRQISGGDNHKLDQFLTNVREIEQRIERIEKSYAKHTAGDAPTPDAAIPASFTEYVRLNFDMLHLAFLTDNTRVATFMISGDGNNRDFNEIGIPEGHHFCTHHRNQPDLIAKTCVIDHWYVQQLAYFLNKMDQTQDVDGNSLLHNSMIIYGSGHADGNRHTHTNLPIILAGAGGGALTPGRYIQHQSTPVTNLYLSLMDKMGAGGLARFGDSTGRLANI
ncbi:MAG: DUF1552 domain-containing protein [Tepidisphaeraceae bacterium]|jgi:hypothetical protein